MMGHNMFLWRNMENYPHIIYVTPSYLEHGVQLLKVCYGTFLHFSLTWLVLPFTAFYDYLQDPHNFILNVSENLFM